MKDINKTKKQLVEELEVLRARVVGLELVEQKGRDAEGALLGSEKIYRNLVESTVEWVWAIDQEGNHTFSNHAIKELLGYEVDKIVGASAFLLMHPDDQERIRDMVQQAIQRKSGWAGIPIRWLHKDGSTRYFESTAQPILNDEEELSGFSGIDRDITERKLVEEALRESEEKYRRLYSSMNEGVALHEVIIDEYGKAVDYLILDVNPAYESITGLKKNQVVGHNASEIYGMGQPPYLEVYLEVASSGQPTAFEATFEPAGRTFSISVFSPGPGQFATVFTDITERVRAEEELKGYRTHLEELVEERAAELQLTIGRLQHQIVERKQAEKALRESETRYRAILEALPDLIFRLSQEGTHVDYHTPSLDMLVVSPDEFMNRSVRDTLPSDVADKYIHYIHQALQEGDVQLFEYELELPHQDKRFFESRMTPCGTDDVLTIVRDITERKRAEEALAKTKTLLQSVLDQSPIGVAITAPDGTFEMFNNAARRLYALEDAPGFPLGENLHTITPSWKIYDAQGQPISYTEMPMALALQGKATRGREVRIVGSDGLERWAIQHGTPVHDQDGNLIAGLVVGTDITERKRVEEAYRSLVDNSLQGLLIVQDGRIVFANQAVVEMSGYTLEELLALSSEGIDRLIHPDDREFVRMRGQQRLAGASVPRHYAFRFIRKDGTQRWVEQYASLTEFDGKAAIQTAYIDITERKHAEETLLESEEKYRGLVEQALIGIGMARGNQVIFANEALLRIFGYGSLDEFAKIPLLEHVAPAYREMIAARMKAVMEGKAVTSEFEYDIRRKDGTIRSLQVSNSHLVLGGSIYTQSIFQDITERKLAEVAIRQYNARLEAMQELSRAILAAGFPDEISRAALHHIRKLIPCQRASVAVVNPEVMGGEILAAESDEEYKIEPGIRFPADEHWLNALEPGKPVVLPDISSPAKPLPFLDRLQEEGFRSLAVIPLVVHERRIGTLNMMAEKADAFTDEHVQIAGEVANQLAIALQQAQLLMAERHERLKSQTLQATAETLAASVNLDEILNIVISESGKIVEYDRAMVLLVEEDEVRVAATKGFSGVLKEPRQAAEFPLFSEVMNAGEQVVIMDTRAEPRWRELPPGWPSACSWLGSPLIASDTVLGLLNIDSDRPGAFSAEDVEAMRAFASQAAIAVRNAHIITRLEDNLLELKQAQERLIQTSRLTAAGEVAAGVAHQINNPIGAIIIHAHLLMKELAPDTLAYESAETIKRAAYRAGSVVQRMLNLSKNIDYTIELLDINLSIQNAVSLLRAQIEPNIARLLTNLTPNLPSIEASLEHLEDVWLNLLLNARDAVAGVKNGQIKISSFLSADGDAIEITVHDNGTGISPEDMEHIFEPFFTTKVHDRGTGLGLAICHEIITRHGGTIQVESEKGQGTTFAIKLPLGGPYV